MDCVSGVGIMEVVLKLRKWSVARDILESLVVLLNGAVNFNGVLVDDDHEKVYFSDDSDSSEDNSVD